MADRRILLMEARRFRTCPPPGIRTDPAHRAAWEAHLRACPDCADDALDPEDGDRPWFEFAAALQKTVPPDLFPDPPPLAAGQFRLLAPAGAGWAGERFFNPPVVLIRAVPADPDAPIPVALTYPDPGLAGPGDLILSPERTGRGALFVETWNTGAVDRAHLGPAVGEVDEPVLAAAAAMADNPSARPDWAPLPRPFQPEDPRQEFRHLESEVAAHFLAPVVAPRAGSAFVRLAHEGIRAVREALAAAAPRVRWPEAAGGLEGLLAGAAPVPRPLAAADDEIPRARANLLILREGRIADFRAAPVDVSAPVHLGKRLGFSGRITDLPAAGSAAGLLACLMRWDRFQQPASVDWDPEGGWFYVEFHDAPHPPGELALAVLWEGAA